MNTMNVYQKIIEVKKVTNGFNRDGTSGGTGAYKYVTGSQILAKIKDKMNEIGLLFIPVSACHRNTTQYDYTTSKGAEKTDFIVEGNLAYAWVNADNPTDRHVIEYQYYGQQDEISKAFGSALTYSERYLLLKSLGLPTDDEDPDSKPSPEGKATKATKNNSASNGNVKGKYGQVMDLIKTKVNKDLEPVTIEDVSRWITKSFKKDIRINDLTDDQFFELFSALEALNNA